MFSVWGELSKKGAAFGGSATLQVKHGTNRFRVQFTLSLYSMKAALKGEVLKKITHGAQRGLRLTAALAAAAPVCPHLPAC